MALCYCSALEVYLYTTIALYKLTFNLLTYLLVLHERQDTTSVISSDDF